MASTRIQIVISGSERERLRALAADSGESLSQWIRKAAEQRAQRQLATRRFRHRSDVVAFFDACDEDCSTDESEPEWSEHLSVINASKRAGDTGT